MALTGFFLFVLSATVLKADMLTSQNLTCHENDLRALKGFQNCLFTTVVGWGSPPTECCSWIGITCDNSTGIKSRVVGLDLADKGLQGEICEALAGLDHLKFLNLSQNNLEGGIAMTMLFQMHKLEVLDLSYNYLYGSFPVNTSLPSIRSLNISNNQIEGPIDATFCGDSPNISAISFANNDLYGDVPSHLGNCTSLTHLSLNGNHLSGRLSDSFFQLSKLNELYLQGNNFSGTLDGRFSNLSSLATLDISYNAFFGLIPDIFAGLQKLDHFSARSNSFQGQFPSSLVESPSISNLDLSNNNLFGPVNFNCSAMLLLSALNLSGNSFEGPIPESLSTCQRLKVLDLGYNNFIGDLPIGFRNFQSLKALSLSQINLSNVSMVLDILAHSQTLSMLVLSRNFFNEHLPNHVHIQFVSLKIFIMSNCGLMGSIPSWLHGCMNLQIVGLSGNQLSGEIPYWFGDFSSMFFLDLSNNSLTGVIPKSLTKLENLVNYSINMDEDFYAYTELSTPKRVAESYKDGTLYSRSLQDVKIWEILPTLDLSDNQLNGPIWPDFGNLKSLHVLNLRNNNFSGSIPESLSGMINLEVLDLSKNNLSGEFPHSLVSLHNLQEFNISYNNISGEIPSEKFPEFPFSSYLGNNYLCLRVGPCRTTGHTPNDIKPEVERTGHFIFAFSFDAARLSFIISSEISFVLTVVICFASGWAFKSKKIRR